MATNVDRICVTGATGFIASHIIAQLLNEGYKIHATVRSLKESSKFKYLQDLDKDSKMILFEANLNQDGSFDDAITGCDYILHTASPYALNVKDPQKDLVDPAVQGTINVLNSCLKNHDIKKVVITSSMAAVTDSPVNDYVYTEDDWNIDSSLTRNPYYYSKVLAEKAAWKWMTENTPKFELVVINPSVVMGPEMNPTALNTSNGMIVDFMTGKYPGIFQLGWGIVDVRDVAKAHLLAIKNPKSRGRYITCNKTILMQELIVMLRKHYPNYKYPSADLACDIGSSLLKLGSYFQPAGTGSYLRTNLGKIPQFDSSKVRQNLGIEFMDMETTITDTAKDLIGKGHLPDLKQEVADEVIQKLAFEMRQPKTGVEIKDRRWGLRNWRHCFVGSEGVSWLLSHANLKHRDEAIQLGRSMMRKGVFSHVADKQNFADEYYFYSFNVSEDSPLLGNKNQ